MRKTIASFVLAVGLITLPETVRAQDAGDEILFSTLATVGNVFYVPAKVVVAALGLAAGGVAGTLSGGNTRAAYAFWVPAAGGQYFLTADQMAGNAPIEFFGSDWVDRPSTYGHAHHGSKVYDAGYYGVR